jgi:voltage-gated potassium channel
MADLAASDGRVKLNERLVTAEEVGTSLHDLRTGRGVRIYRNEQPYGFCEPEVERLEPGDIIIEIVQRLGG